MLARLFCTHCNKYYRVDVENIKLVQKYENDNFRYSNNTYYYSNACFFKELNKIQKLITQG